MGILCRSSLLVIVIVWGGPLAQANDLSQLYDIAVTRDAVLQSAAFQRDALIEARPQAVAALLPQVAASASAARNRDVYDTEQISSVQAAGCELAAAARTARCYGTSRGLGLNLSQTLWSYQAFNQLKEADAQAAAAQASFRGAQQDLVLRVAQAYFAILSAGDQLVTNRSERQAFGAMLEQARVRQNTGVGAHTDVAQAQAFYDATEQNVIDAQNSLDDALLALTQIVGQRPARLAPLREDIPLTPPEPASAEEWVTLAREENLNVRAAQFNAQAASRDVSVQRGRGLPTLSLVGSNARTSQNEVLGGNQSAATVGVSFNWPLFEGGAVASAVRQARASYGQAQAQLDAARRDAERLTRAAFRGIVTGVQRIAAASRAVASGRDAVEASRRAVEFGTGNEFDLLNAQNNYFAAVRAYNQTRYDYLTSVLTLKQQAGRLSERDLLAIDALLVESPS